jgi:hypothetical protein
MQARPESVRSRSVADDAPAGRRQAAARFARRSARQRHSALPEAVRHVLAAARPRRRAVQKAQVEPAASRLAAERPALAFRRGAAARPCRRAVPKAQVDPVAPRLAAERRGLAFHRGAAAPNPARSSASAEGSRARSARSEASAQPAAARPPGEPVARDGAAEVVQPAAAGRAGVVPREVRDGVAVPPRAAAEHGEAAGAAVPHEVAAGAAVPVAAAGVVPVAAAGEAAARDVGGLLRAAPGARAALPSALPWACLPLPWPGR